MIIRFRALVSYKAILSTDHLRCRQIIPEKKIQATSPLKTVWHDRNGGFLKWGLQHSFNSSVISLGGKRMGLPLDDDWAVQTVHVRCPTFVAPQLQQPTVEPRRQSGADFWSVWKGVTLNPKFPKIQWFKMLQAWFCPLWVTVWQWDTPFRSTQEGSDMLTSSHSHSLTLSLSLSLSPRLESSRESLCRLVPFSSEMIECTVRSLPLLWSSIFTFLTTASKLEAGKLDRYSPRYFDGIKLRSLTMSY